MRSFGSTAYCFLNFKDFIHGDELENGWKWARSLLIVPSTLPRSLSLCLSVSRCISRSRHTTFPKSLQNSLSSPSPRPFCPLPEAFSIHSPVPVVPTKESSVEDTCVRDHQHMFSTSNKKHTLVRRLFLYVGGCVQQQKYEHNAMVLFLADRKCSLDGASGLACSSFRQQSRS